MTKKLQRTALLGELAEITREVRAIAQQKLLSLDPAALNRKPGPKSWSAAGCLYHLNYYAAYYHPAIRRALDKAPTAPGPEAEIFRPGWLGDYFARMMKAPNGIPKKKLPTLPASAPHSDNYSHEIVRQFIGLQDEMLGFLKRAAAVDLGMASTGTTATELIRMKLGDALRVVIYHNERHVYQALRAVETARATA
jgi:hypothetical protein